MLPFERTSCYPWGDLLLPLAGPYNFPFWGHADWLCMRSTFTGVPVVPPMTHMRWPACSSSTLTGWLRVRRLCVPPWCAPQAQNLARQGDMDVWPEHDDPGGTGI